MTNEELIESLDKRKKKENNENSRFPIPRPPFIGRYYIYAGKRYLFTHRHPKRQAYWSDDVGFWVDTDKLKPCD